MRLLYNILEWMMRFFVVNLLWIIFNIPVVYLLISLLLAENQSQFISLTIILVVISPFLLFPATAGMFGVIRKWIMNEREIPVVQSFWKFYKENYVKSMFGGFIIEVLWIIFIVDCYYFITYVSEMFIYLFIIIFILLFMFTVYFISTIIHFEAKLLYSLKNAMLITVGRPILSLGLGIINALIIYVSVYQITFLIPTFMGTLITLVSFAGFYKVYVTLETSRKRDGLKGQLE